MTRDPDLSAKSAVTVPMPVTPKPAEPAPDPASDPSSESASASSLPDSSAAAEQPALSDEQAISDEPAVLDEPLVLDEPAASAGSAASAESAAAAGPGVSDETVALDLPAAHREPAAADESVGSDEPTDSGGPTTSSEPTASAGSAGSAEPAVSDRLPPAERRTISDERDERIKRDEQMIWNTPVAVAPSGPLLSTSGPEASAPAAPESSAPTVAPSEPELTPRPVPSRTRAGGIGVALVLVAAGLLFTTSAATARGTQLRSEHADLASLIAAEDLRVKTRNQRVAALYKQVQQEAMANTESSKAIKALEERSAAVITAAGLRPMTGPGLTVTLDDAPRDVPVPAQAGPDDLVVHQQDVQAVVNALWAGGAEAMMLQDQRVISTSAVRCVGNTLILQGRVYSPPYRITVIGDVKKMQASLDSSPQIAYYLQYVASLRLGWEVKRSDRLSLPAYAGSLALTHARVPGSSTPSSAGPVSSSS